MDEPNTQPSLLSNATPGETSADARSLAPDAGPAGAESSPAFLKVFIGPNGMRAGWRLVLFLSIALVCGFVFVHLVDLLGLMPHRGRHASGLIFVEATGFLAVLCSAAIVSRIENRTLDDYALPGGAAFGSQFWQGALWGFVSLSVLLLSMRLAGGFEVGSLAIHGADIPIFALLWAAAFLLVGCFEEFLFRGYALYTLATGMGFWPAAILLSLLFGAVHLQNAGENWVGGLGAMVIGVFWSLTLRRTGSLWFAIGLHASWDYAESFIFSVPDSGVMVEGHLVNSSFHGPAWLTGGAVGPEGSALVFLIMAAMFVTFHGLYREVQFPLPARQPENRSPILKIVQD